MYQLDNSQAATVDGDRIARLGVVIPPLAIDQQTGGVAIRALAADFATVLNESGEHMISIRPWGVQEHG